MQYIDNNEAKQRTANNHGLLKRIERFFSLYTKGNITKIQIRDLKKRSSETVKRLSVTFANKPVNAKQNEPINAYTIPSHTVRGSLINGIA